MSRLTELLDLPSLVTERTLCKLVTDKTVFARIDRPAGIVTFKQRRSINEVLNVWSGDIGKMLSLVEKTSHLVSKVSLPFRFGMIALTRISKEYAMHEASRGKKVGLKAQ